MTFTAHATIVRTPDHRYFAGDVALLGVTSVLKEAGLCDFTAPWFDDYARDRGGAVAAAIALDVENDLDEGSLDPALIPYLSAWRLYLAESGAVVEHCEAVVGDVPLGYAGTLDAIVRLPQHSDRRRLLVDVKLGLYPSVGPQTAAYARAAGALYQSADDRKGVQSVFFDRAALVLTKTGTYRCEPLTDRTDDLTFIAALRVASWRKAHGFAR
jgi:hypothetical protein